MIIQNDSIVELQQTKKVNIYKVVLRLEFETRFIGIICITSEGIFFCKRKASHLFKKQSDLGLNHELLTSPSIKFKWIVIDFDGSRFVTSRKYFLAKGKQYQFGKKGFEPQVFLPLAEFGIEKARAFERNNSELSTFNFNE